MFLGKSPALWPLIFTAFPDLPLDSATVGTIGNLSFREHTNIQPLTPEAGENGPNFALQQFQMLLQSVGPHVRDTVF